MNKLKETLPYTYKKVLVCPPRVVQIAILFHCVCLQLASSLRCPNRLLSQDSFEWRTRA